jgi:mono/diheme cytochrome c family protein
MRKLGGLLIAVAACAPAHAPTQPPSPAAPPPPTLAVDVDRGAYVAAVSGCAACHGADYAGGKEHKVAAGVWRAPNITPDRATGIGGWSNTGVITAIRDGVLPDGERLVPVMPYTYYHAMTDRDAEALVAYLRSRYPVHHQVAPSEVAMRPVMMPREVERIDRIGDTRAHGRYLATLMHCAACHGASYAGGMRFEVDGKQVVAPNITSDAGHGLGRWSEADVMHLVRGMVTPNGRVMQAPMAGFGESWSKLTDDDARALAAYVKSIPALPSRNDDDDARL